MHVKEAIAVRRSIRQYEDKRIPEDIVTELLNSARKAPSAKNTQPHKYFVVKSEETKKRLKEYGAFEQDFVYDAPLIIVCCADPTQYPESIEIDETAEKYAYIDLSIAASFLVLRATELGLGTVFVAWVYRDRIKEVLNIPEKYIIPFVISVGYPAEDPDPKPRKDLSNILF